MRRSCTTITASSFLGTSDKANSEVQNKFEKAAFKEDGIRIIVPTLKDSEFHAFRKIFEFVCRLWYDPKYHRPQGFSEQPTFVGGELQLKGHHARHYENYKSRSQAFVCVPPDISFNWELLFMVIRPSTTVFITLAKSPVPVMDTCAQEWSPRRITEKRFFPDRTF